MNKMLAIVVVLGLSCTVATAEEPELVGAQTVWRVWMATGPGVSKEQDEKAALDRAGKKSSNYNPKAVTELPPAGWNTLDYDDHLWGRYGEELFVRMGGFGCRIDDPRKNARQPAVLCLRTRFGVSDPSKATDLKVTIEYLGGAIVFVNGVEIGRGHLPEGPIEPHTLATDYPVEAYTTDDGQTPLPVLSAGMKPEPKWVNRYQTRVRKMTVGVPAKALVKGANVLAMELHRARVAGPDLPGPAGQNAWGHVGIRSASLVSGGGTGVIGYADALKCTRVWIAEELEQIAEEPVSMSKLLFAKGQKGGACCSQRGPRIAGIAAGNPFDPALPIRILVPRNGIGSGMAVLSDPDGLRGVSASVKDLTGPGGAALPAKAVRIRFATQDADLSCCDTLQEKAPENAKTLPVWLEVKAPKDQTPGWYVSELSLEANGKKFQVSTQVFVTGYIVPDAKDFRSLVGVMHSPEVAAKMSQAAPWSDAHFATMAKSLEAAGQLGNDIMYVPVIIGDHMGHKTGLIRWTKTPTGLQPDFTAFEKYLDVYLKYCAPPKAIILYVWSPGTVEEAARGYEHTAIPTQEVQKRQPLQATQWDPATGNNTAVMVPSFLEEGAEAIWKPMLDGVHSIVLKRGWSERVIMVGTGCDVRPGVKTGEIFRKWAPYARWDIYSHFSGDPAPGTAKGSFYKGPVLAGTAPGKQIAIGDLEVGVKEHPWFDSRYDEVGLQKLDFLDMPLQRAMIDDDSPPLSFRTFPLINGRVARLGLDFWPGDTRYNGLIWGAYPLHLLARGPAGPLPTVRLQMMREGFQDFEPRLTIMEAIKKLPAEEQKPYQTLLNDISHSGDRHFGDRRLLGGNPHLSQEELRIDWPAYLARTYRAAEELTGIKTEGKWEEPPK
ncbi:MAG: glycoside hydrolase domain-containing protein [Thermoguttaceae bacterium]